MGKQLGVRSQWPSGPFASKAPEQPAKPERPKGGWTTYFSQIPEIAFVR